MKSKKAILIFVGCAFLMAGTVFPVIIRYRGYSLVGHVLFLALLGWCAWVVERTMSLHAESLLKEVKKQAEADQAELCAQREEAEQKSQEQSDKLLQLSAELTEMHHIARETEEALRQSRAVGEALDAELETLRQTSLRLESELETERQALQQAPQTEQIAGLADSLAGQIVVALAEAAQAVDTAIDSFAHIAQDARESAQAARSAMDDRNELSVTHSAEHATDVMNSFVRRMESVGDMIAECAKQIQSVMQVSRDLSGLLDEVEKVADQTALLSLNASIEAARAGESGRGFAVVAGEVRKLSEHSRSAAERMRQLTQALEHESDHIHKQLTASTDRSARESAEAQQELGKVMVQMERSYEHTQRTVQDLSAQSMRISEDIGRIIIAFQFHDLLRQRLEHVHDPLCALRDELLHDVRSAGNEVLGTGTDGRPIRAEATGSRLSVGKAPELTIVKYAATEDEDDNITLF